MDASTALIDVRVVALCGSAGRRGVWDRRHARHEALGASFAVIAPPLRSPDSATRTTASKFRWSVSENSDDSLLRHPLLAAVLERLAALVAERVHDAADTERYYTTKDNPLGSARAFRDAARRKCFPSFKLSREIAAKRVDVHAWIESRGRQPTTVKAKPPSREALLLEEFGLRATRRARTDVKEA